MSNRDTTLSPYFNHKLLGAAINAIATSSILKVAQGAYSAPGAVAVTKLFNQPKMRVERAAAQPPAAGVSGIVANAFLHARGPIEGSADDRLDAEMGIRMTASATRKHHRTQDCIRCRGGAPTTTTTTPAVDRLCHVDYGLGVDGHLLRARVHGWGRVVCERLRHM